MGKIIKNLKGKITLGTDPELFLIQPTGKFISAVGLIQGTKDNPEPIPDYPKGFAVQVDCTAVEFNVPPASTALEFSSNIARALEFIRKVADNYKLIISRDSFAEFDEDQLQTWQSLEAGCQPDFNAYTATVNHKEGFENNARCTGGHIAVGYKNPSTKINMELVKAMDLFLTVPSVLMDNETRRRAIYGQAGSFRNPKFGVEHRSLSNFWIFTDELRQWAFRNTMQAVEFVMKGNKIDAELGKLLQETINHSNKEMAAELVKKYNLEVIEVKEETAVLVEK